MIAAVGFTHDDAPSLAFEYSEKGIQKFWRRGNALFIVGKSEVWFYEDGEFFVKVSIPVDELQAVFKGIAKVAACF